MNIVPIAADPAQRGTGTSATGKPSAAYAAETIKATKPPLLGVVIDLKNLGYRSQTGINFGRKTKKLPFGRFWNGFLL